MSCLSLKGEGEKKKKTKQDNQAKKISTLGTRE